MCTPLRRRPLPFRLPTRPGCHHLPVGRLARTVRILFAHVVLLLRQYFAMISNAIKGDGST